MMKIGLLFWRTEQVSWMLRLNKRAMVELNMEERKAQMDFRQGRTIGIQVRHGYGCNHGRQNQHGCKPLSQYFMEARQFVIRMRINWMSYFSRRI